MAKKLQIVSGRPFQADWNVTDENNMAYIRNKPSLSDVVKMKHAIISSSSWIGEDPYTQSITLDAATPNSKIDVQPNADIMAAIIAENYRLSIKNDNGAVTIYAFGAKPSNDLNLQLTITEIVKENELETIWGNVI